ncbi:hypothetical protein ACFL5F_08210 [Planctomycetota bacterium]
MWQEVRKNSDGLKTCHGKCYLIKLLLVLLILIPLGCRSPVEHRSAADRIAAAIITTKQKEALGETEPFSIERPSDILRRRLLEEQNLAISSEASLGTDQLKPVEHWPDPDYMQAKSSGSSEDLPIEPNKPVKLSLVQVLQVGARNSLEYQSRKEDVFRTALALDLTRHNFENIFDAGADSELSTNTTATNLDSSAAGGGESYPKERNRHEHVDRD